MMFAVVLGGPLGASAQSEARPPPTTEQDRTQRARDLFAQGSALADEDRWGEALVAFEQSAALRGHASTTYNMGYCERGLGHYTRARMLFARAVEQNRVSGGGELTADQQAAAEQYLREANQKLARIYITVEPSGAHIQVDGRPLELQSSEAGRSVMLAGTRDPGPAEAAPEAAFTLILDPGAHSFALSAAGAQTQEQHRFEAGEERGLHLVVTPAAAADDRSEARTTRLGWAIGMAGLSLAAITLGSVLGGVAIAKWDDAQEQCPQLVSCPNDGGFEASRDARQLGDFATVSFAVAGASLASAVLLWLTAPASSGEEPDSVTDLAIAPSVGPTSVGLGVTARFR